MGKHDDEDPKWAPRDENELRHMVATAVAYTDGPIAVRYPRGYGQGASLEGSLKVLEIGKGEVLVRGGEVALVGIGSMVPACLGAAEVLGRDGIKAWVINARFAKPIDEDLLSAVSSAVDLLVTVEENTLRGGFGDGVGEMLADRGLRARLAMLGLPDRFVGHGRRGDLLEEVGLSAEAIARAVKCRLEDNG